MAFVYILECNDGTFYTGSTRRDPQHREWEHNFDPRRGANYTWERRAVRLIYTEQFERIDDAYNRERQLHGWGHRKKAALIEGRIGDLKAAAKSGGDTAQ
ncbi:MAG: GIY-YIG nuclease family protein [Microbacterium sp.]|uniref:GIY-YIG nuclease family protein n=1 Tax=Microbacterium sp. TaxID=51671 RepID=UPI003A86F96F